jgi:hypothetical protein
MDRATKENCSWIMIQATTTTTDKNFISLLLHLPIFHTQQLSLNHESSGYSKHKTQIFFFYRRQFYHHTLNSSPSPPTPIPETIKILRCKEKLEELQV